MIDPWICARCGTTWRFNEACPICLNESYGQPNEKPGDINYQMTVQGLLAAIEVILDPTADSVLKFNAVEFYKKVREMLPVENHDG